MATSSTGSCSRCCSSIRPGDEWCRRLRLGGGSLGGARPLVGPTPAVPSPFTAHRAVIPPPPLSIRPFRPLQAATWRSGDLSTRRPGDSTQPFRSARSTLPRMDSARLPTLLIPCQQPQRGPELPCRGLPCHRSPQPNRTICTAASPLHHCMARLASRALHHERRGVRARRRFSRRLQAKA